MGICSTCAIYKQEYKPSYNFYMEIIQRRSLDKAFDSHHYNVRITLLDGSEITSLHNENYGWMFTLIAHGALEVDSFIYPFIITKKKLFFKSKKYFCNYFYTYTLL